MHAHGQLYTKTQLKALIYQVDSDRYGKIDFDEFCKLFDNTILKGGSCEEDVQSQTSSTKSRSPSPPRSGSPSTRERPDAIAIRPDGNRTGRMVRLWRSAAARTRTDHPAGSLTRRVSGCTSQTVQDSSLADVRPSSGGRPVVPYKTPTRSRSPSPTRSRSPSPTSSRSPSPTRHDGPNSLDILTLLAGGSQNNIFTLIF